MYISILMDSLQCYFFILEIDAAGNYHTKSKNLPGLLVRLCFKVEVVEYTQDYSR